jgi:hypothetical protein
MAAVVVVVVVIMVFFSKTKIGGMLGHLVFFSLRQKLVKC